MVAICNLSLFNKHFWMAWICDFKNSKGTSMTDLTLESLQAMLTDIAKNYSAPVMKPTKLIIGRSTYRMLMWRPKIQPAASIRKRKRAVSWRKPSKLQVMLK